MAQVVYESQNSCEILKSLIKSRSAKKVLFVTGRHFPGSLNKLTSLQIFKSFHLYTPFKLLQFDDVDKAVADLPWKPEMVIAIGGGSVIDFAKLIVYQLKNNRPLFAVMPTIAGSGSESTSFAVIYKENTKISVEDASMLPDFVFIDTSLLSTLDSKQKAISGIDAVCQAIESIWSLKSNDVSLKKASVALDLLWNNMNGYVYDNEYTINRKIFHASYLAGQAINITHTTGCHALSYYLTALHDIPHGQAVAFFLPAFFIYNNIHSLDPKYRIIYDIVKVTDHMEGYKAIKEFISKIGLFTTFSEASIDVNIDLLLASTNMQRFDNNPTPYNKRALKDLILNYVQ